MCEEDPYGVVKVCAELENTSREAGSPSSVAEADKTESPGTPPSPSAAPKQQVSDTSSCADQDGDRAAVFFARVPPLVPHEELLQLFGRFGTVLDLNLFKRWSTAKASKGCGIVEYATPEAAAAAMLALNGVHTFDTHQGCEGPMVVEWMDASRLTSADAAATQKAVKAKAAAAAAAAAPKPQQRKAPHSKPSSSSSAHSSASQLPSWSYVNSISALAHCINAENQAMAALAAARAGCEGGSHPAVEALDLLGLMGGCGPLSPDTGCSSVSSGLGDPSSWSTVVPVHLLPIVSQPQPVCSMGPTNTKPLSPLLPPAAALAAAFSQMHLNSPLLQPPGVAGAVMPSPGTSGACGLQQLTSGPHACSSGVFGCMAPSVEPCMSGCVPSCTSDSANRSLSTQLGAAGAASVSQDLGFLAAVAAAEQQLLLQQHHTQQHQQQLQQQQQQQHLMPLMLFEDAWASQSCEGKAASINTGYASDPRHVNSSGGHALFDTNSMLLQLNEAAAAAAGASAVGNSIHTIHSTSSTLGSCAGAADAPATLSGPLNRLQGGAHGYLPMHGSHSSSAASKPAGRATQQQGGSTTVHMRLTEATFSAVVPHVLSVMKMSGAKLNTSGDPGEGVYQLGIQGSAAEIEAAKNLVDLLSAGSNA